MYLCALHFFLFPVSPEPLHSILDFIDHSAFPPQTKPLLAAINTATIVVCIRFCVRLEKKLYCFHITYKSQCKHRARSRVRCTKGHCDLKRIKTAISVKLISF